MERKAKKLSEAVWQTVGRLEGMAAMSTEETTADAILLWATELALAYQEDVRRRETWQGWQDVLFGKDAGENENREYGENEERRTQDNESEECGHD